MSNVWPKSAGDITAHDPENMRRGDWVVVSERGVNGVPDFSIGRLAEERPDYYSPEIGVWCAVDFDVQCPYCDGRLLGLRPSADGTFGWFRCRLCNQEWSQHGPSLADLERDVWPTEALIEQWRDVALARPDNESVGTLAYTVKSLRDSLIRLRAERLGNGG